MKFVILLSLVALCYSLPATYGTGKSINISDDGTITITTVDGKKVVISKAIGTADRFIDVSVEGPNIIPKRIQIDSQSTGKSVNIANGDSQYAAQYDYYADMKEREKRSPKVIPPANKTQGAILAEIFEEYQGVVDDKSYINLLAKVSDYVELGKLDPSIYDILAYLNEQRQEEQQQQIDSTTSPYKTWRQALWESWILNYLKSKSVPQNPELSSNPQQPWAGQPWAGQTSNAQPWNAQQSAGQPWNTQPWAQQTTGQPWNSQQQWPGQPWNTQPWTQQPAGQPWNAQPLPQQPAGQPWNAQPLPQQPAGQPWNAQPLPQQTTGQKSTAQPWNVQPWNVQQTTGQQWPTQQWPVQQWPAQQWPAQQWPAQQWPAQQWPAQQWPVQQSTQSTGRTAVPLRSTQGPSVVNAQLQQPAFWPQQLPVQQTVPVNQPVGPDEVVYQPVYQPGFPWMQFYWNRVLSQQKDDSTTTTKPTVDARV